MERKQPIKKSIKLGIAAAALATVAGFATEGYHLSETHEKQKDDGREPAVVLYRRSDYEIPQSGMSRATPKDHEQNFPMTIHLNQRGINVVLYERGD